MILSIDLESKKSIFKQLQSQIIKAIANGELKDGDVLPSIREMASDLGINMHTVNKAYSALKEDGYVSISKRGVSIENRANYEANKDYIEELEQQLELNITKAITKGIEKEDIEEIINKIYKSFKKGELWYLDQYQFYYYHFYL
ncbi:MAG: GntR family transcriptional regulator [Mycoplasmatales bacterium]